MTDEVGPDSARYRRMVARGTATLTAAAPMSEKALQEAVIDLARWLGVLTYHPRPARTSAGDWVTPVTGDGAGWPDLVLVGAHGILYRELKSATGTATRAQQGWLDALHDAGGDIGIWRPTHWASGTIWRELARIAGRWRELARIAGR